MACLFFSGFETGDTSEWSAVVGTTSVQTSTVLKGGYSSKATSTASASQFKSGNIFNNATAYARCRFRIHLTTNPTSNQTNRGIFHFMVSAGTSIGYIAYGVTTGGAITLNCYNSVGAVASANYAITADTTYLLELKVVVSATVGIVEFKIDGVIQETLSAQNTGTTNIAALWLQDSTTNGSIDCYWDDIYVDDAAYPGAGQCVTRQGLAGTPTYDAWSKTGLTTSALCWSETPFGAVNYCNNTGSAEVAQTMLTESFSITQTGHGTETIAAGDTINACSVGVVARAGSGTPPVFSIRRRLAGTDTDVVKTLTTSDKYYVAGFFTDTLANLNAAEVGALRAATAQQKSDFVEEAWLMVDYTPSTAPFPPWPARPNIFAIK